MIKGSSKEFWDLFVDADADFSGIEFIRIDFSIDLDASWRDFSKSSFKDSKFVKANLYGSDWSGAVLDEVLFEDCVLERADFRNINAKKLVFLRCELEGAEFDKATVSELTMDTCSGKISMEDAKIEEGAFRDCNLANSSFDGSNLNGALIIKCILEEATFTLSTLRNASLFRSVITDCEIFGALDRHGLRLEGVIIYPTAPSGSPEVYTFATGKTWVSSVVEKPAILVCSNEEELTL